jgi:hypothetical protein
MIPVEGGVASGTQLQQPVLRDAKASQPTTDQEGRNGLA